MIALSLESVRDERSRRWIAGVQTLERAWEQRELASALADDALRADVGLAVASAYACLLEQRHLVPSEMRRASMAHLLEEALQSLSHPLLEHRAAPLGTDEATAATMLRSRRYVSIEVNAANARLALRHDQWTTSRFWGLGWRFDEAVLQDTVEAALRQHVAGTFARALHDLEEIAHYFARKNYDDRPSIPPLRARRFERLMLDILNEHEPRARQASVAEDFFNATDLRVSVEGLQRSRGARVQVSSDCGRGRHVEKLERMEHGTEVAMLSPFALADAIRLGGLVGLGLDERPILAALGCERHDPGLAHALRGRFEAALEQSLADPRGPALAVAPVLRQFIGAFVDNEARWTTANMRRREQRGSIRGSHRRVLRHRAAALEAQYDLLLEGATAPPASNSELTAPRT